VTAHSTKSIDDIIASIVDRRCHMLFDWIQEQPGQTTKDRYTLYSEPLGPQRGYGKTNMPIRMQLPPPNQFLAQSAHAYYGTMPPAEREIFRERYTLSFWVLNKRLWQCPLEAIPLYGLLIPADARKLFAEVMQDAPRQGNEFSESPILLPSLVMFWMELDGDPVRLEHGLRFCCGLNGLMDWAVQ
jgi:hypothetical protein